MIIYGMPYYLSHGEIYFTNKVVNIPTVAVETIATLPLNSALVFSCSANSLSV